MADISSLVPSCLDEFRSLNDSLAALTPKCGPGEGDVSQDLRPSIKNQLGRFRVWSTNLGAHRTGRSSLDYRLQDASHIRTQVINLLNGLVECLQDGTSIVNGTVEPWDSMEPTSDDEDSYSDGPEAQSPAGLTELSQIVSEASEIINCLFRLSVSIHHPAPHDRFRRSAMIDTSHYEAFDSAHIQNKFPSADQGIVNQLGKANSFRRQYFRYREEHHRKLAQGLPEEGIEPPCDDTKTVGDTTVASSLPQHLRTSNSDVSGVEDFDSRSEAGRTETSFAPSSIPDGSRSRMPSMPDEAQQGPFECPFCYRMISVETTKDWRKHVLGDLRPYICLYPDCSAAGQDFQRRHQWMQHVQQAHWNIFLCPFGCKDVQIDDVPALKAHLATFHNEHAESLSPESLIRLSEQERPLDAPKQCELCSEELDSFKAYTRHVGRHQEDVALFVLPNRGLDEESLSDDQKEESERHDIKMPDGLQPFLFEDTAVLEDRDKLPSLVEALGWDYREAVPPPPQPSQGPLPKPPPYAPERERSQVEREPLCTFKYRRPDGSVEDGPEQNVPVTFASSHQAHGPHHDDALQDGPGPKDGSSAFLTATQLRDMDDMESDLRYSDILSTEDIALYPHMDASNEDSQGRITLAPILNTGNEVADAAREHLLDNPDSNPDEHLGPESSHRYVDPYATAQNEPGGAAWKSLWVSRSEPRYGGYLPAYLPPTPSRESKEPSPIGQRDSGYHRPRPTDLARSTKHNIDYPDYRYSSNPTDSKHQPDFDIYTRPSLSLKQTLGVPHEDKTRRHSPHDRGPSPKRSPSIPYRKHSKSDRGYDVIVSNPTDEDHRRRRAHKPSDAVSTTATTGIPTSSRPPLSIAEALEEDQGDQEDQEDQEDQGDGLDLNTGQKFESRRLECRTKATEGCLYKAGNQKDLRRHLLTCHPVYARENEMVYRMIECNFPGCEFTGNMDQVLSHQRVSGHRE